MIGAFEADVSRVRVSCIAGCGVQLQRERSIKLLLSTFNCYCAVPSVLLWISRHSFSSSPNLAKTCKKQRRPCRFRHLNCSFMVMSSWLNEALLVISMIIWLLFSLPSGKCWWAGHWLAIIWGSFIRHSRRLGTSMKPLFFHHWWQWNHCNSAALCSDIQKSSVLLIVTW